jgi:hypothetical protein
LTHKTITKITLLLIFLLVISGGLSAISTGSFKALSDSSAFSAYSTSSATATTQSSVILGDSEDYLTCLTYQSMVLGNPCPPATTAAIDASWTALIANLTSSPTNYVSEYSWNTFKVGFAFQNLNTPNSAFHYLNYTLLDSAVTTIHNAGFKVILDDADFANFGSAAWVQDWLQLTQHYKGDSDISAFDLFEEPSTPSFWSSNVTTTNPFSTESVQSAYYNVTRAIRAIDASRTIIWFKSSDTLNPAFTLPNVIYDFHLDANQPDYNAFSVINQAYDFARQYNVTVGCFELNVVTGAGFNLNQTEAQLAYMKELGIGYMLWLYTSYVHDTLEILKNPYVGQWLPTTSYPLALNGQSCVTSGPNSAIVLYCIGGVDSSGTDYGNAYYASLNSGIYKSGVPDPWTSASQYAQSVAYLKCAVYSGTDYCVGGESGTISISNVYSAVLSSSGIGTWTPQTSYPTGIEETSCFTASVGTSWADLYCVGGLTNVGSITPTTYYTSLVSGALNWASGKAYPLADQGVSCLSAYLNAWYGYCVGGKSSSGGYSTAAYFSAISQTGFGTWEATTSYPIPISDASCSIWNSTIYCIGGQTAGGSYSNSVYYAPLSSLGIGAWQSLTNYSEGITDTSCKASTYWLYCVGGKTSSGSSTANSNDLFLGVNPTLGTLLLQLNDTSAPVGTAVTWTSTGWKPAETVTVMAFNPNTLQYINLGTSVTNSSGMAIAEFVVPATLSGSAPNQVYAEDPTTPPPHIGYQTGRVNFNVTSSTGPLLLNLSSNSGSVGSKLTWTSTGWNPGETVTVMAFNPTTKQYIELGHSTTNSSGIATGSFIVPTTMVGSAPNQVYGEDATTPFPHTGYETSRVSFTVTSSG